MKNKGQNQKLFLKNFPLKLLGFVLAVLLWLVLNNTQDPVITSSVSVPITYEEGGLAEKNMVAISKPNAITIPVKLHRSRLRYLSADDFTVKVMLRKHRKPARSVLKLQRHHLPHIFKAGNIHSHKGM